ncbi:uncharacterized protein [Ptychodera flava]|uniref:uncharacterized protein n=1 Tax=Ptychodera flava TaxID=63121 RepID=UPI00396A4574
MSLLRTGETVTNVFLLFVTVLCVPGVTRSPHHTRYAGLVVIATPTETVRDVETQVTNLQLLLSNSKEKCDKYKGVKHSWDMWHGGKDIHKKVVKASQSKKCRDLLPWASTIRNHFWYAAKESKGSERKMKAIWFGILQHVVNEHEWLLNIDGTYGKCAHSPLTEENQQRP